MDITMEQAVLGGLVAAFLLIMLRSLRRRNVLPGRARQDRDGGGSDAALAGGTAGSKGGKGGDCGKDAGNDGCDGGGGDGGGGGD